MVRAGKDEAADSECEGSDRNLQCTHPHQYHEGQRAHSTVQGQAGAAP